MPNNLYYCRIKVSRDPKSDIPDTYAGAYVPAFAAAEDHQRALGLIIPDLAATGWIFEELENHRVDELYAEHWEAFLDATWPDLKANLPDREAIDRLLEEGGSFYGPFSVWTTASTPES